MMRGAIAAAAAVVAGCASNAYPASQLASAEAAVASAIAAGAAQHAAPELKSAQEKLALAKRWIAAKDYEPARWLAEQARVDADLATAKAFRAAAGKAAP
jgi:hypothetical protein